MMSPDHPLREFGFYAGAFRKENLKELWPAYFVMFCIFLTCLACVALGWVLRGVWGI